MFGHAYFGSHYFGPHYFGPALEAGAGSGEEPGSGGGGVGTSCDVTYEVDGSCPPPVTQPGVVGPQGPPGPPGTSCDWCCPIYCGDDSPEGVVTGEIGAPYEQANAAITTHPLWVKRDDDGGNTGWRGWAGLRGEAAGSFAIGDNSVASGVDSIAFGEDAQATGARAEAFGKSSIASADDAKAFGSGASVTVARGIGLGAGASVTGIEGISIGDGIAVNANDVIVGWSHVTSVAVAKPNIVIGFDNTINTALDPSATDSTLYGGHILIGYQTETPYHQSNWHNTVIGYQAKAHGRASVIIGDQADGRVANSPVAGLSEAVFATVIGYKAKASGGCVVSVGDQCDVRGSNAVAVGTNSRANDDSTAALGPNCFAGSTNTNGTGANSAAIGVSAQALIGGGVSVGVSSYVGTTANFGTALGYQAKVNNGHFNGLSLGARASSKAPQQVMFGASRINDFVEQLLAIHFANNNKPSILITAEGKIQFVDDQIVTNSTRVFPITANITLDGNDYTLFVDATSGARTITLPVSASVPTGSNGKRYTIRRESSNANSVTIATQAGEFFDDGVTTTAVLASQWKYIVVKNVGNVGAEWVIEASN